MGDTTASDGDPDAPWKRGYEGWDDAVDPSAATESADQASSVEPLGRAERSEAANPADRDDLPPTAPSVATGSGTSARAAVRDVVDDSDRAGERRRSCAVPILIAVVVVSAAVAVVGIVVARRGGEPDSASTAPALPESIDRIWTRELDELVDDVAIADELLVVGGSGGLTAYDLDADRRLWNRPGPFPGGDLGRVLVAGDVVLVQTAGPAQTQGVAAFDRLTGGDLWVADGSDGRYTLSDPDGMPLVLRRRRVADRNVVESIDPVSGLPLHPAVAASSVTAVGRELGTEPEDRRVAVWSPDTGEIVAGPVDSFDLRAVASLDGQIVALDLDGRIASFDETGLRTDAELVAAPAGSDPDVRADLVGVVPPVAIVAGEASLGFTVDDDAIEVVWQRAGRASPPVSTSVGAVSLLVESIGGGARRESIIDITDGATVVEPPAGRSRVPTLASNGFLLAPPSEGDRVLDAVGYDLTPLWSLTIDDDADYQLVDGAVVVIERRFDGSVLTVAR